MWQTYAPQRRVLAVVHNVTAATRLLDVLDLIAEDVRVEVDFTDPGTSEFPDGTAEFLGSRGVRRISWAAARTGDHDLAISASHGDNLHELSAPLLVVPHGMGYNKYLDKRTSGQADKRTSGQADKRTSGQADKRTSGQADKRTVFGLCDEWLLHDRKVVASALIFSHPEQVRRLARDSPAAVPAARIVGDLVLDQLRASDVRRRAYRRALGVGPGRRLVLVTSTWGPDSLLGAAGRLPIELGLRLPVDEFRVVVAAHPNVRHGHSPWQVRRWFTAATRAGVDLLDDLDAWRAALVAADVVVGDHGSVTFWAAALGRPVLLAAAPEHTVAPDSPVGMFLRRADRLDRDRDPAPQLRDAVARYDPARLADVTDLATSVPGGARRALRAVLYEMLGLDEPPEAPDVPFLPVPAPPGNRIGSHLVRVTPTGRRTADVTRHPAERLRHPHLTADGATLVVGPDEEYRRWHELADVVVGTPDDGTPDGVRALLDETPGAALAVAPAGAGWLLGDRRGRLLRASTAGALYAPVALRALHDGHRPGDLTGRWTITTGGGPVVVDVEAG